MEDPTGLEGLEGETALVEAGDIEVTGTVTAVTGLTSGGLTISCDADPWESGTARDVNISIFAPEALYRLSGSARANGRELVAGGTIVERIQRRRWPRRRMDLPVTLCPVVDGSRIEGVPGRTVDVSVGGICVETLRHLDGEGDPMVIVSLPDGMSIVSGTTTVHIEDLGDGWRYRLAFRDLNPNDATRLAAITS